MADEYHPGGYVEGGPVEVRVFEGEEIYTAAEVRRLFHRLHRYLGEHADAAQSDAAAIALYRASEAVWKVLDED